MSHAPPIQCSICFFLIYYDNDVGERAMSNEHLCLCMGVARYNAVHY